MFVPETFCHVAKTVAMADLTDHIIDVVFTLFDENSEYDGIDSSWKHRIGYLLVRHTLLEK